MRKYCKADKENGTKQCAECGIVKLFEAFTVRKTGYVYAYCKDCNARRTREWSANNRERKAEASRNWRDNNPERSVTLVRKAHYKRRYGIDYADVLLLLEKQSFRCEICSKEISSDTLVVDHCHGSGKIRGVLCNQCNIWLSPLERPGFLDAATAYLESHRSKS